MSVSDVFLDTEFKYVSRISITHSFHSRLKGWNLLRQDTKVCFYRGHHEEFKDLFSQEDGVFCDDVCSVMEVLGHEYNPDQWRLFVDSSKVSLKLVLLHNGNRFPSLPLAHAANMKESYESMKLLLGKIKNDEFRWKLCGDLKVVARLLGMQLGYTKYCCSLCEWDSRDKKNHYVNKLWPKRTSLTPVEKNVVCPSPVFPKKIYQPPWHIKLDFRKNSVKGMDKTGRGFQYMRNKFPNVNDAKIKEGIFIGPQIRELMQDIQYDEDLNETERNAWLSDLQGLLRESKSSELSECFAGPADFVQSYGMQNESENPLSGVTLGFFPGKSRRSQ